MTRLLPVLLLALYCADAAATLTHSARQMGVETALNPQIHRIDR